MKVSCRHAPSKPKHHPPDTFPRYRAIPVLLILLWAVFALSPSVFADDQVFAPGAYIIDMGRSPQTVANGLKPYGLVYDLVRNNLVPVYWAIQPGKLKDGVDFTADGKGYRGGPFIISADFASDAIGAINNWQAKGVSVDGPIESAFVAPVYKRITGFPNVVIDDQSDGLVTPFYENAEIPSTAYRIGFPYDLGPCDDVFVMPHADPSWEDHKIC